MGSTFIVGFEARSPFNALIGINIIMFTLGPIGGDEKLKTPLD